MRVWTVWARQSLTVSEGAKNLIPSRLFLRMVPNRNVLAKPRPSPGGQCCTEVGIYRRHAWVSDLPAWIVYIIVLFFFLSFLSRRWCHAENPMDLRICSGRASGFVFTVWTRSASRHGTPGYSFDPEAEQRDSGASSKPARERLIIY